MDQPIQQALVSALNMAALAAGLIVLSLIVVILIDVPFQLWNNAKQLRMTKEEVKQEHKDSEGDPHVK
ncbi:EscU/YscU/HrcU family type III secretion system export apparatus switch protein, partial [Burkholderia sp. SIMBA_045]